MSIISYGGSGDASFWNGRAFPKPSVHASSLAVTPLEILDLNGDVYTHGTAFIYRLDGHHYLVTAWHVVSGRDFFSRKLNGDGLIPHAIRIFVPGFSQENSTLRVTSNPFTIDFHSEAQIELQTPPQVHGFPVDVAVAKLPLQTEKGGNFRSEGVNEFEWGFRVRNKSPISSMIGADIFVLGYPLNTYEGLRTPIWKRGAIASEPAFEISPKGAFLVDVNSAGGMSGGPILRRVTILTAFNSDNQTIEEKYDEALIGIYTGRALSKKESSFVLGYGWPVDFIHEVVKSGQCYSGQ